MCEEYKCDVCEKVVDNPNTLVTEWVGNGGKIYLCQECAKGEALPNV